MTNLAQVKQVAQDLFAAGTFTTTEHFLFFVRIVALWPEVQEKMRAELDGVYPPTDTRWVGLKQKELLPYCRAVQEEVFRWSSHVPLSISHWTTADTTLQGYTIPKDTLILPNIWAVHMDPQIFPNPTDFSPERFLDADGNFDDTLSRFVLPFSYGWHSQLHPWWLKSGARSVEGSVDARVS